MPCRNNVNFVRIPDYTERENNSNHLIPAELDTKRFCMSSRSSLFDSAMIVQLEFQAFISRKSVPTTDAYKEINSIKILVSLSSFWKTLSRDTFLKKITYLV